MGSYYLTGIELQIYNRKRVKGMEDGDGCTTIVNTIWHHWTVYLKMSNRVNFMLCAFLNTHTKKENWGASLVVQWLGIFLPMQGTRVRSLVGVLRPTCLGTTKPMCHNDWTQAPGAHALREKPPQQEACTLQPEQLPLTPTRGSRREATKTQHSHKWIN